MATITIIQTAQAAITMFALYVPFLAAAKELT